MELSSLRIFLCVAEERSLTKASSRLHYVQSNLSARIRQLEEEVGHPLFSRTRQGMPLTDHGERLVPLAKDLVQKADDLLRAMKTATSDANLRIATPDSFFRAYLKAPLQRWRDEHPESKIIVQTGFSPDNLAALHSRAVDLAVVVARSRPAGVHVVREIPDRMVFISPLGTGLGNMDRVRALQPLVLGDACFFGHALSDLCDEHGLVGEHRRILSSVESILQCVQLGLGMTVLPQSLIAGHPLGGQVQVEALPGRSDFTYFKVCLPQLAMSSKVREIERYF